MTRRSKGQTRRSAPTAPAAGIDEATPQGPKRQTAAAKSANPAVATGKRAAGSPGTASPDYTKKTIALVYDFDGTLSPRPMQEYAFLPKIGIDAVRLRRSSGCHDDEVYVGRFTLLASPGAQLSRRALTIAT